MNILKLPYILLWSFMVMLTTILPSHNVHAQCKGHYPVAPGAIATYEIENYQTNMTEIAWFTDGNGTIIGDRKSRTVTVQWNNVGSNTITVRFYQDGIEKTQCWTVPVSRPLNPGTINSTQTSIVKNEVLSYTAIKNVTAATDGLGQVTGYPYVYQWQESTDGTNWTPIPGAFSLDCVGSTIADKKYYFRRKVDDSQGIAYSNVVSIDIINTLNPGTVNVSQVVQPGNTPTAFTSTAAPTGGTDTYTYQWESSTDELNWTSVSGATTTGYQSPALNTTAYFRRKVTSGTQVKSTNVIQVLVKGTQTVNKPVMGDNQATTTKISPPDYSTVNPLSLNTVRSYKILKPGVTNQDQLSSLSSKRDISISHAYLDGLNRVIESIHQNAGNNAADLVQFSQFDQYGRQVAQHLPYLASTSGANKGAFRTDVKTAQPAFFNTLTQNKEDYFYGHLLDELSPDSRFIRAELPGKSYTGSGVGVSTQAVMNSGDEHVRVWKVGPAVTDLPMSTTEYAAGTLAVRIETNQHGLRVAQYIDLNGKTVMTAMEGADGSYKNELRTYYVYDEIGNLRYVVPPLATKDWWDKTSWDFASTIETQNTLKQLGTKFFYDTKGRTIIQEIAGKKGVCSYVYDNRDRLVLVQNQTLNNRNQGEWMLYLYDGLDRVIAMALYQNAAATRESLQAQMNQVNGSSIISITTPATADLFVDHNEGRPQYTASNSVTILPGFDSQNGGEITISVNPNAVNVTDNATVSNPLPNLSGYKPLLVYYYDNYNWSEAHTFDKNYILNAGSNLYAESTDNPSQNVYGKVTGYKVLVPSSNQWLKHTIYYDESGRVIQQSSGNIQGGTNVTTVLYDYNAKILSSYTKISNPQSTTAQQLIIQKRMDFDEAGKITKAYYAIGNGKPGVEKQLYQYTYDDLNRLKTQTLGNGIETLNYDHDLYGRLKGINTGYSKDKSAGNYFGMELFYENGFTDNRKDGNLSGVTWRRKGNPDAAHAYGYTYDHFDRLTKADYTQNPSGIWVNSDEDYTMSSQYDDGGNITRMKEEGMLAGKAKATIDDLTYEYGTGSNQLKRVTDAQGDKQQGDFKNYSGRTAVDDYTYDDTGNLTGDKNKGIIISYDYLLGKPDKITLSNNAQKYISYTRDITGNLLQRKVNEDNTAHTYTFLNGAMYKDNELQYVLFSGGRVRLNAGGEFVFDYFLKDYLGNTRTVITEEQNTYGYKATHEDNPSPQPIIPEREFFSFPQHVDDIPQGHKFYDYEGVPNRKFVKLNYTSTDRRIGTGKVIRVMAGDQVSLGVRSYYQTNSATNNTPSNPASDIVAQLINVFLGPASVVIDNGKGNVLQGANGLLLNKTDFANFVNNSQSNNPPSTTPRAYLNYVLFDDNLQMVSGNAVRVSQPGEVAPLVGQLDVSKNGYIYVYVSNESNTDVYFDDLVIQHKTGPLLQENSYYPYGLQITGLSSTALNRMQQNFLYNGIEKISDFDLELYDAFYRTFDPQLGRWLQIDPEAAKYAALSGYNGMMDNPVNYNDPLGDDPPWWMKVLSFIQEEETRRSLAGYVLSDFQITATAPIALNNISYLADGAAMHFVTDGITDVAMEVVSRNSSTAPTNANDQLTKNDLVKLPVNPSNPYANIEIDDVHPMFVPADPCVGCQDIYAQKYWARESLRRMYETSDGQSFQIVSSAADAFTWEYGTHKVLQGAGYVATSMGITGGFKSTNYAVRELRMAFESVEAARAAGMTEAELANHLFEEARQLESLGLTERIGEYRIDGVKGMVGKTFRRHIWGINLPEHLRGNVKLFKWLVESLEQEARAAGAAQLEIYGSSIHNTGFLNPRKAALFGYTSEVIGEESVVLTKKLIP